MDNAYSWLTEGWKPDNLRKPGFSPATLIDVGVGAGTNEFYEAFPEAYIVLVEPLREFEPDLKHILAARDGEYFLVAAGATEAMATLYVDGEMITKSSICQRTPLTAGKKSVEKRMVHMRPLDALRVERGWEGPFGLKIDAEGFEPEVIEGSLNLLKQTQFVIAEVSVAERFREGYTFADFVALMDRQSFALADVLSAVKSWNSELLYVDVVFRRTDGAAVG